MSDIPNPAAPRICRIKLGRTYNLGNYENQRFDVELEIPPGVLPSVALIGMERIIDGLKWQAPDSNEWRINDLESTINTTEEAWRSQGYDGDSYKPKVEEAKAELEKIRKETGEWKAKQSLLRALLDDPTSAYASSCHVLPWEQP